MIRVRTLLVSNERGNVQRSRCVANLLIFDKLMTMILGPLVVAVLVGLGAGEKIPPYREYAATLEQAHKTLIENIISMEGHIPLLNDTRRQYAEIVHVVNFIAQKQTIDPYFCYNEVYYKYLNTSASEGISHPENVIAEVKYLIDEVHNHIMMVKDLIDSCNDTSDVCDETVFITIRANMDIYGVPALIFIEAARTATEFNERNEKFEEVSKDLNANQYVCTSPDDLRVLVWELARLYQTLNDLQLLE